MSMNNSEIQIQFPKPGEWGEFTLTAIYPDEEGYTRIDRYQQNDVTRGADPGHAAVVAALVGLSEPWQASQVWRGWIMFLPVGLFRRMGHLKWRRHIIDC